MAAQSVYPFCFPHVCHVGSGNLSIFDQRYWYLPAGYNLQLATQWPGDPISHHSGLLLTSPDAPVRCLGWGSMFHGFCSNEMLLGHFVEFFIPTMPCWDQSLPGIAMWSLRKRMLVWWWAEAWKPSRWSDSGWNAWQAGTVISLLVSLQKNRTSHIKSYQVQIWYRFGPYLVHWCPFETPWTRLLLLTWRIYGAPELREARGSGCR